MDLNHSNKFKYMPYLFAVIAHFFYVVLNNCFKVLAIELSVIWVNYAMNFLYLFFSLMYLYFTGQQMYLNVKNPHQFLLVCMRSILSTISIMILVYNNTTVTVSIGNTFHNLGPLLTFFLQSIIYKKPIIKIHLVFTLLSFIGVSLIVRPQFIFGSHTTEFPNITFHAILGIIGALTYSGSYIMVAEIKTYKIETNTLINYFSLFHVLASGFLANFREEKEYIIEGWMIPFATIMMLAFALAQYFMYKALYMGNPTELLPIGYTGIISALIFDYLYFHENLTYFDLIGIFLTSIGLIVNVFVK